MDKLELLKKLQNRVKDLRGNENERLNAENQLNALMKKYGIVEEDLETEKKKHRDFYFKTEWERNLISQVLYTIRGKNNAIYKFRSKRNWLWTELTDAEYIEFETLYPVYKAAFQKEFEIFYLAFINKNKIFPPKDIANENPEPSSYSRSDRMRAAMMAEGMEFIKIRRQIGDGKN